jgi:hypothetical protein
MAERERDREREVGREENQEKKKFNVIEWPTNVPWDTVKIGKSETGKNRFFYVPKIRNERNNWKIQFLSETPRQVDSARMRRRQKNLLKRNSHWYLTCWNESSIQYFWMLLMTLIDWQFGNVCKLRDVYRCLCQHIQIHFHCWKKSFIAHLTQIENTLFVYLSLVESV